MYAALQNVWFTDSIFCVGSDSELRTGSSPGMKSYKVPMFRDWKARSLRSGVLDQRNFIIEFPLPETHSEHFLVLTCTFGPIYRTEQYIGPSRGCCSGRKPVRVIGTKITHGFQEMCGVWALVRKIRTCSYFCSSTPEWTLKPFRSRSTRTFYLSCPGPYRRTEFTSKLPQNSGSVGQNFGHQGIWILRSKVNN